jgi:hypothetical protein
VLRQARRGEREKENLSRSGTFEYRKGVFTLNQPLASEHQQQFVDFGKVEKEMGEALRAGPKNKQLLRLKEQFRVLAQQV